VQRPTGAFTDSRCFLPLYWLERFVRVGPGCLTLVSTVGAKGGGGAGAAAGAGSTGAGGGRLRGAGVSVVLSTSDDCIHLAHTAVLHLCVPSQRHPANHLSSSVRKLRGQAPSKARASAS
jgi:hypothetical protein